MMVVWAASCIDLEGVGILIPPQIEFKLTVKPLNTSTRAASSQRVGVICLELVFC
jgi:hypothetical protein